MKLNLDIKVKLCKQFHAMDLICQTYTVQSDSSTTDTNVFMIEVLPGNALGQPNFRFSHVADAVDMQDYPDHYDPDYAYFRTNAITLRLRSQYLVNRAAKNIYNDVCSLVKHINYLETTDIVNYYIGGKCDNKKVQLSGVVSVNGQRGVVQLNPQTIGALSEAQNKGKPGQVATLTRTGWIWADAPEGTCSGQGGEVTWKDL